MRDGLVVRLAVEADAPVLTVMIDELNAHQGEETGHITVEAVQRDGFGPHPEFRVFLAELNGEPVGYALFHPTWSTEYGVRGFYLYDLYVREAGRGQGAGRAMMAALARLAQQEGRTFLWWCSKPWNQDAQAFYGRLNAIEEPNRAHALFGDAFAALAAEAGTPR